VSAELCGCTLTDCVLCMLDAATREADTLRTRLADHARLVAEVADLRAEIEGLTAERDHYRVALHAREADAVARIVAFAEAWNSDDTHGLVDELKAGAWRGKEAP